MSLIFNTRDPKLLASVHLFAICVGLRKERFIRQIFFTPEIFLTFKYFLADNPPE